jgi:hypothetical protein
VRHDLQRERARTNPQQQPPVPADARPHERERLAGAVGNAAMQRAAASPAGTPRGLVTGAPMSIARFSASSLAQRPTGALREYEEQQNAEPEGPKETPPAEGSAPAEAPAPEPETIEPVEEPQEFSYDAMEESYV